jgi:hypothetical protein
MFRKAEIEQRTCRCADQENLDNTNAVGHVKSIEIFGEPNVRLLQTLWRNQSVDLVTLNGIQFPCRRLDLAFVGLNVNDKAQRVVVFNQLHAGFCRQRVFDDRVLIQCALLRHALSNIFRLSRQLERLGLVKVDLGVDAGSLFGNPLLQGFLYCFRFSCCDTLSGNDCFSVLVDSVVRSFSTRARKRTWRHGQSLVVLISSEVGWRAFSREVTR